MAQTVKNPLLIQEAWAFNPWVGKIPWSKKRQSTPVFLPGECHRQRSLAGYSPWGRRELDATFTFTFILGTKICISLGAGRVGRVEGRFGRKKGYSKTIRLPFGFVIKSAFTLFSFHRCQIFLFEVHNLG